MEFGAHLPLISFAGEQRSLADLQGFTEAANELGYQHLCANDHLIFSRPWLDGPIALASVLDRTGQMRLTTTVALPVVRGPAATAKTLAAIDLLSGGRLTVGVGPGSSARDYELVGLAFEERWRRLDESIRALRAFFRGVDHQGRFYGASGFDLQPRPAQPAGPPIWIGSWGSAAGMRRVARLGDGWIASGYNTTPERFTESRTELEQALTASGRSADGFPNAIATIWTYVTEDPSVAEEMLTSLLLPMLNRPLDELRTQVLVGSAESCAAKLREFATRGAQRAFLWPIRDETEQLRIFREQVWPIVEAPA